MRVVAWALVVAVLAGPSASAGSADDPEIQDERGDHTGGVTQDPFNGYDIMYAFFADDAADCGSDHMRIQIGLANVFTDGAQSPGAAFSASVYFSVNGNEYRTYLRPAGNLNTGGDPAAPWIYMYDITQASSTRIVIPGGVDNSSGNEFYYWCVPHDVLAGGRGDTVTDVWARTYLDNYGVTDRAPDDGVGREYVIGGAVETVLEPLNVTVSNHTAVLSNGTAQFTVTVLNNGTADQTIQWSIQNITAGFDATVEPSNATVAPGQNLTFNVTVFPGHPDNGTGTNGTAQQNGTDSGNGTAQGTQPDQALNGTLQLAYSSPGGNGTLEFFFEGPPEAPVIDEPDAGLDSGDEGKETPGFAPVLLLVALAVAVRRRH